MTWQCIHKTTNRVIPLWVTAAFEVHILQQWSCFFSFDFEEWTRVSFLSRELVFSPGGWNSAKVQESLCFLSKRLKFRQYKYPWGWSKFLRDGEPKFCEGHCAAQAPMTEHPDNSRIGLMWFNKRRRNWVQKRIVRDLRGSRAVQLRMRQLITNWTWWLDFDSKLSWGE